MIRRMLARLRFRRPSLRATGRFILCDRGLSPEEVATLRQAWEQAFTGYYPTGGVVELPTGWKFEAYPCRAMVAGDLGLEQRLL